MKKKTKSEAISTLIGKGTQIEGTISFDEVIRIDGHVTGRITSDGGTVIIGEPAVIKAEVKVATAVVRGEVEGEIQASDKIEIFAPGKISGNISAPVVSIDAGVVFNGNCAMEGRIKASDSKKNTLPKGTGEKAK